MADYKDTENALDALVKEKSKTRTPVEPAYSKPRGQVDVLDNHIYATQVQLDKVHKQMAEHLHDTKTLDPEAEADPVFDNLTDQARKLRSRLVFYQDARKEFGGVADPNSIGANLKRSYLSSGKSSDTNGPNASLDIINRVNGQGPQAAQDPLNMNYGRQ